MSETQPVAAAPNRPPKSWLRRNWGKAILLVLLVAAAGSATGGYFYWRCHRGKLRASEPCQMAFQKAAEHPRVIELLGEPVKLGLFPDGDENHFNVVIYGRRGEANMAVDARKFDDHWGLVRLEITFSDAEDAQRLTIDTSADGADEAPAWKP